MQGLKKKRYILFYIIIIFCIILIVIKWSTKNEGYSNEVLLVSTNIQDLTTEVLVNGLILPAETITLKAPFNTYISRMLVSIGDEVKKGDVLVEFEGKNLEEELLLKRNELEIGLVLSDEADSNRKNNEYKLNALELEIEKISVDLELSKHLFEQGIISKQELDNIQNNLKEVELKYQMQKSMINLNEKIIQDKKNTLLKMQINEINKKLSETVMRAPVDGIIMEIIKAEGMPVTVGESIIKIPKSNCVKVSGYVSENDINNINEGLEVNFLDDNNNSVGKGRVTKISHIATNNTSGSKMDNGIVIEMTLELMDDRYKIYQSIQAEIVTRTSKNALTVPIEAVVRENNEAFVWVEKDGKYIKTKVEIGIMNDFYYEIIKGLDYQDLIVLYPNSIRGDLYDKVR
ncbi:efflux RND transporter periplasmic adaptor subunit [Petrocella sp. FN5]|uniref:efflux RND transporter periplasmic adaptor subunit n=1 Tax=Petrocella sp. FN5 TaxID=3032002 RepID=UPI0023DAD688|nr:HlyD family efflux transporter periplasmic adaptor subunit [Petrocella sp. FN5]MDF1617272.1 HlyD family efflux transporter periplasmic adaptor subunit [Petrocella sp. FN5]